MLNVHVVNIGSTFSNLTLTGYNLFVLYSDFEAAAYSFILNLKAANYITSISCLSTDFNPYTCQTSTMSSDSISFSSLLIL